MKMQRPRVFQYSQQLALLLRFKFLGVSTIQWLGLSYTAFSVGYMFFIAGFFWLIIYLR